jgi:hypothetical protein
MFIRFFDDFLVVKIFDEQDSVVLSLPFLAADATNLGNLYDVIGVEIALRRGDFRLLFIIVLLNHYYFTKLFLSLLLYNNKNE